MTMPAEFTEIAERVNNWGRWGEADERGTLNLVTDAVVRRAAGCVRTGKRFSLALPLGPDGPQTGLLPGRFNPIRTMLAVNDPSPLGGSFRTSDDMAVLALQGATHWDSLAHASYDGRLYNGVSPDVVTGAGAARLGIDRVGTLVSRGVLLDVARARGTERCEPGYAVTNDDLSAAEELGRLSVTEGDVVVVRTGHMGLLHAGDKFGYTYPTPGLSMANALWFHERGVAAVATDTMSFEVFPCEREGLVLPVHLLDLVEMGMTQGQNFDLEALADDCADDGVYEFLLSASPEPFVAGLGAPVVPVALK